MLTVTPCAADMIRQAARDSGMDEPMLRLAARYDDDAQSIEFGIGFDERREQDEEFDSEGVTVLVSPPSREAALGTIIDYVEYRPGDFRFIFYRADAQDAAGDDRPAAEGCSGCGCGPGGCA